LLAERPVSAPEEYRERLRNEVRHHKVRVTVAVEVPQGHGLGSHSSRVKRVRKKGFGEERERYEQGQ
jgi:shikimate kinase